MLSNIGNTLLFTNIILSLSIILFSFQDLKNGQNLIDQIINTKTYNIEDSHLVKLSGGLGSHAGPGALVAGLQEIDL